MANDNETLDPQSRKLKYKGRTTITCRVCEKEVMRIRDQIVSPSGRIDRQLECPRCGEGYPQAVDAKGQILVDPFT